MSASIAFAASLLDSRKSSSAFSITPSIALDALSCSALISAGSCPISPKSASIDFTELAIVMFTTDAFKFSSAFVIASKIFAFASGFNFSCLATKSRAFVNFARDSVR